MAFQGQGAARRRSPGVSVWQRNDYEHIIRDQAELERIRDYTNDTPLRVRVGGVYFRLIFWSNTCYRPTQHESIDRL